jgi:hypothetical protein
MAYDYNSVAVAAVEASPVVRKNAYRGNVQVIPVDFTVPTGNIAQNKTVALSKTLPAGAKVVWVHLRQNTIGNTLNLGVTGAATALVSAADTSADSTITYLGAPLDAGGKEIYATAGNTWTAAKTIKGFILITTDE